MFLADSAQIRRADDIMIREKDYPGILLMEAAGSKSAEDLLKRYPALPKFLVLAGPGNNGGDGLVMARILALAGKDITMIFSSDPEDLAGDAKTNYLATKAISGIRNLRWGSPECDEYRLTIDSNTVVVDALLGTGIRKELKQPIGSIIAFFRDLKEKEKTGPVAAVDLPSGLSADSGEITTQPLPADVTYSFQLPKICYFISPASEHCGGIVVVDIGITDEVTESLGINRSLIRASDIRSHLHRRGKTEHKGTFGHVLVIGGSGNMCGSVALTASAVMKSGAGLCTVFTPGACKKAVFSEGWETMVWGYGSDSTSCFDVPAVEQIAESLEKFDIIAIGPGIGNESATRDFIHRLMDFLPAVPTIWDADAINILAENPALLAKLPRNAVLTPHPGEMKRLLPDKKVIERRIESAEFFSSLHKCIVVLKGANTIVAFPDGKTRVNTTGNPGMATAGSGDVLTGIIAARTAISGLETGVPEAVFIHGLAGDLAARDRGMEGLTAGLIADFVGRAYLHLAQMEDYPPVIG